MNELTKGMTYVTVYDEPSEVSLTDDHKVKIEDNFLEQKEFDKLQDLMLGGDLPWYFSPKVVYKNEAANRFQFTHHFYTINVPTSDFMEQLRPLIEVIRPLSLWFIKANLLTRTLNIIEDSFHVDFQNDVDNAVLSEKKLKQWTTGIFYVNTNNGYTEFEEGTKVESIANRFVSFSANLRHTGTSCTDEKSRVIINFNYFQM